MVPRFHHQLPVNSVPLAQTIAEEEEQLSSATNNTYGVQNEPLSFGNSKLPKPSNTGMIDRVAKKAGASWLSRLRSRKN